MPARHTDVDCNFPGVPTLLSDGAVSAIRIQFKQGPSIRLQATLTSVPPTTPIGGVWLSAQNLIDTDMTLAKFFPGIGAGAMFVWAYVEAPTSISVSHA